MPRLTLGRGSPGWPVWEGLRDGFLGLTFCWSLPSLASAVSIHTLWKETVMDTAIKRIGAVVVAELRACGYMESTIGQYQKSIRTLTGFVDERGGGYTPVLGAVVASMTVS